jgi:hypothetical protein
MGCFDWPDFWVFPTILASILGLKFTYLGHLSAPWRLQVSLGLGFGYPNFCLVIL